MNPIAELFRSIADVMRSSDDEVEDTTLFVNREEGGRYRWFAIPACTAVLNRDGEIDSRDLFDDFVTHAETTGEYPILDFYHTREAIPLGKADWVARDGVNYCASGLFDDTEIARAAAEALMNDEEGYWGLSIAYVTDKEPEIINVGGKEIAVFRNGVNRYISILPEEVASSLMTSITNKEVSRMKKEILVALERLVGGNKTLLKEFETKVDTINRASEGMIARKKVAKNRQEEVVETVLTDEQVADIVEEVVAEAVPEVVAEVVEEAPADVDAIEESIAETDNTVAELAAMVADLVKRVEALEGGKEQEIEAIVDEMPERVMRSGYRARAAVLPQRTSNPNRVDMAAIAESTLSRLSK